MTAENTKERLTEKVCGPDRSFRVKKTRQCHFNQVLMHKFGAGPMRPADFWGHGSHDKK
jgi:hypothetical protein